MSDVCDDVLVAYPPVGAPRRLAALPNRVKLTVGFARGHRGHRNGRARPIAVSVYVSSLDLECTASVLGQWIRRSRPRS